MGRIRPKSSNGSKPPIMLEDLALDKIEYKDVEALFNLKKPEGQRIDYKGELYRLDNPDEKAELLADVCSFANTYGGHLLLGIYEKKGVPTGLVGVECDNPDAEIRKMTDIIREWSEPRLNVHTFKIRPVNHPTAARKVFIVRIEASPNAPHSGYVSKNGIRQFFTRHSNGKSPMNTSELRDVFVASETAFQRMREFREFRVMKRIHTDEELPESIGNGPKLILHVLPFASFSRKLIAYSANEISAHEGYFQPPLYSGGIGELRPNLDGLASVYRLSRSPRCHAYVQVNRNGVVEAVNAGLHFASFDKEDNPMALEVAISEQILIRALRNYVKGLKSLGVQPPAWGAVSMTGMKGLYIRRGNNNPVNEIDRAFLLFPEFEIANFDDDPGPLLKNTCDAICNAAGLYASETFKDSLQNAPA
jgi:Putative DNA-binding domain